MNEHKTIIDNNGFIIERCILLNNGLPQNFIKEDGQEILDFYSGSYLKPQWNGTEWIETATQDELDGAYPVVVREPTETELLKRQLLETQAMLAEIQEQILLKENGGI